MVALQNVVGAALVFAHAEAFRTDGTLVAPLPIDIADKLIWCRLVRSCDVRSRHFSAPISIGGFPIIDFLRLARF